MPFQMDRLQVEIDEENETRTELYEERSKAKDRKKKAVVESLLVSIFLKITPYWVLRNIYWHTQLLIGLLDNK